MVEDDERSRDEASQFLKPYIRLLREALVRGWKAWKSLGEKAPELKVALSGRTRATFVYDHVSYNAKLLFAEAPGVKVAERRGFLELIIHGRYCLRFKKLDKRLRSRNIMTNQQRLWLSVTQLPGMPPDIERLIAGYTLDLTETDFHQVLVTKPRNTAVAWWFEIPEEEQFAPPPIIFPAQEPKTEVISTEQPEEKKKESRADADDDEKDK